MHILTINNRNFQKPSRNPSNRTKVKILERKKFWISLKKNLVPRMLSSGGQISTKHLKTSIRPFFATCRLPQYPEFAKNLRSFDGFDQMSRLWSMFRFRSFRIFCEKIAIFRTFDHWSEILSMSAGRPLGQGVCPPLLGA